MFLFPPIPKVFFLFRERTCIQCDTTPDARQLDFKPVNHGQECHWRDHTIDAAIATRPPIGHRVLHIIT